jgi:hypothetical protein
MYVKNVYFLKGNYKSIFITVIEGVLKKKDIF